MTEYARLDSELDAHDVVYGIVLPNLKDEYHHPTQKKEEYTLAQAKQVDFTALPMLMNHNNDLHQVGITVAYRVRDGEPAKGETPRAEAVFMLNREPDQPVKDDLSRMMSVQRNLLMEGLHRGLSLGHDYHTEYVGNCGTYAASIGMADVNKRTDDPYGDPGRVIHKEHKEISVCDRGLREGSEILEYLPCRRSLERSDDDAIRSFTKVYNYTPPPPYLHKQAPGWSKYLDTLEAEVRQRRRSVLTTNGYGELLRAKGTHAASADRVQKRLLKDVPWVLLPYVSETTSLKEHNIFKSLGKEIGQTNR